MATMRARSASPGKGRQAQLGGLAQLQRAALRLGHRHLDPDRGQSVHARETRTGGHGHALAHHEFGHQPALGHGHGIQPARFAAAFHLGHQAAGHAQQQQALPGRLGQGLVLERAHREEFALRRHPFGQQQIRQRRARGDHVARCARIDALDEARGTRLHDADLAVVEQHGTHDIHIGADAALHDLGRAQAQRLHRLRRYAEAGTVLPVLIGVLGHQVHVHEGRFAGLVELLRRRHGVVPIQHLALGGRAGARVRAGRIGGMCGAGAPLGQAPAGRDAHGDQGQAEQAFFLSSCSC
jgi:hypothetical protein